MLPKRLLRFFAAAAIVLAALYIATLAGAPLVAALLALGGGGLALAVASAGRQPRPEPRKPIETTGLPPLPDAIDLVESVDTPLLIVRNRRVLLANEAARSLLGEHIQGVDIRLAIRHPAATEHLGERTPGEQPERVVRAELVGLGQHDRRWEMSATLLKDGSRVVRLTDLSAMQAAETMRVDFVANASHELRTPLATLLGYLETLQDDSAADDKALRARFIRIMFDEARRMHRLVNDLISLSRIEAERFTPPRDPVGLLPLVEEIRRSLAHQAEEQGREILIESSGEPPLVLGDPLQLGQLVQNLVGNALKYGGAGTPVTIRFAEAGPEMLRMSVVDRGDGIAPEHLPRLTERFYRVDPSRSRALGGTGLGLAIVKHIVSRHRGRLDIRSKVGEGTVVHVYLPRAPEPLSLKSHETVTELTSKGSSAVTSSR
jgi:two-component system phosphate regulon sensor histidine kinase PhoR